eukprot:scaffold23154_cov22-Tisochrysis_lutea.AAC.1
MAIVHGRSRRARLADTFCQLAAEPNPAFWVDGSARDWEEMSLRPRACPLCMCLNTQAALKHALMWPVWSAAECALGQRRAKGTNQRKHLQQDFIKHCVQELSWQLSFLFLRKTRKVPEELECPFLARLFWSVLEEDMCTMHSNNIIS